MPIRGPALLMPRAWATLMRNCFWSWKRRLPMLQLPSIKKDKSTLQPKERHKAGKMVFVLLVVVLLLKSKGLKPLYLVTLPAAQALLKCFWWWRSGWPEPVLSTATLRCPWAPGDSQCVGQEVAVIAPVLCLLVRWWQQLPLRVWPELQLFPKQLWVSPVCVQQHNFGVAWLR